MNSSNFMLTFYILVMLLGFAAALWLLFKQDKEKEETTKSKDRKIKEARRNSENLEIKSERLISDLETAKKANESLQLQFRDLRSQFEQRDKELNKIQGSAETDFKAKQDLQKSNTELEKQLKEANDKLKNAALELGAFAETAKKLEELEKQLKEANDKLKNAALELKAVRQEAEKFKESCQILEKALKQKEGVADEKLPKPSNEQQATQESPGYKPLKEIPTDSESKHSEIASKKDKPEGQSLAEQKPKEEEKQPDEKSKSSDSASAKEEPVEPKSEEDTNSPQ